MTEVFVAVRDMGLLALLVVVVVWFLPVAFKSWLVHQAQERKKDRAAHRRIQDRMDERAAKLIKEISQMCRYRQEE